MSQYVSNLTLCFKCSSFPLILFNEKNPKKISIKCNGCEYNKKYLVHNYLHLMKITSVKVNDTYIDSYCYSHENDSTEYCIECDEYICDDCKKEDHVFHQLLSLSDEISTKVLTDKIQLGYNHIDGYCKELKSSIVNDYINKINEIEYSYQLFKQENYEILQLIQLIVDNYNNNKKNYELKTNLVNFIKLNDVNIYKYSKVKSKAGIINFFQEYKIIKLALVDVSNFKKIKNIEEHSATIYSLLLLSDGRLASCSADKTIKIYNIENNYNCEITVEGHTDAVSDLCQLENKKIVSCSDTTIKIWSISVLSYKCECTKNNSHEDRINKVISLSNNRFATCSNDKQIKIWSASHPYNVITELNGHLDSVISILQIKNKEILLSLSKDNTLCKWNLTTYERVKVIDKVRNSNELIEINEDLIMVSKEKSVTLININKEIIEKKIMDNQLDFISFMKLRDDNILCGGNNGEMSIFDIKLNKFSFFKEEGHEDGITCILNIQNNLFATCSYDSTIKIWEY